MKRQGLGRFEKPDQEGPLQEDVLCLLDDPEEPLPTRDTLQSEVLTKARSLKVVVKKLDVTTLKLVVNEPKMLNVRAAMKKSKQPGRGDTAYETKVQLQLRYT